VYPTELVTEVKSNINSVEVHSHLRNNGHPVDGWMLRWRVLVHRGPTKGTNMEMYHSHCPQDGALKVGNFKARGKETESPGKILVEPLDNE
jgi:hypothetical protein